MRYYFIYKVTCVATNRFYIGMHTTIDLSDGYLGSGKFLWNSYRKYGLDAHKFEILEFLPNVEELQKREKEIVNEDLLNDPNCMNLRLGGNGSWDYVNSNIKKNTAPATAIVAKNLRNKWKNPEYRSRQLKVISWSGKHHSEESKRKIGQANSIKALGDRNSQYGTYWITNGIKNQKWRETYGSLPLGFRRGRKIGQLAEMD